MHVHAQINQAKCLTTTFYVSNPNHPSFPYKYQTPNLFTQQQSIIKIIMEIVKISLWFFLLVTCCFSQIEQQQSLLWQKLKQQQQHRRGRAKLDCRISSINARDPTYKFDSEGGTTEFWERNSEEFECAGVAAVRNDIQPKGLLLPHYNNVPQLIYIVQGLHVMFFL